MFGPASHLWLGDKSVSVTQLKLSVRANCAAVSQSLTVFSLHIRGTLRKKACRGQAPEFVHTWSSPARHKNASCEPAITLKGHFFLKKAVSWQEGETREKQSVHSLRFAFTSSQQLERVIKSSEI